MALTNISCQVSFQIKKNNQSRYYNIIILCNRESIKLIDHCNYIGYVIWNMISRVLPWWLVHFRRIMHAFTILRQGNDYHFIRRKKPIKSNQTYIIKKSRLPAPRDEIGHVIACEKSSTLGCGQEVYIAHRQYWPSQSGSHGLGHRFVACLPAGQILFGSSSNKIGVLQIKQNKKNKLL